MKLAVIQSKGGFFYLAVGMVACLAFAAVGAANTQSPLFGATLASAALAVYVALFELTTMIKATSKTTLIVAGGLGLVACFWMIGAVSDAVISGQFSFVPLHGFRLTWFLLPVGLALWTAREIYNRKRPNAPI